MKTGDKVKVRVREFQQEPRAEKVGGVTVTSFTTAEFYPLSEVADEDNIYEVGGISSRGWIWLTLIDDDEYDGYNGDVILQPTGRDDIYEVRLAEARNAFGFEVKLEQVTE